jgi:hypothetical protein
VHTVRLLEALTTECKELSLEMQLHTTAYLNAASGIAQLRVQPQGGEEAGHADVGGEPLDARASGPPAALTATESP